MSANSKPGSWLSAAIIFAILALTTLGIPRTANGADLARPSVPPRATLDGDLDAFARYYDVDVATAAHELALQAAADDLNNFLETTDHPTFAGLMIEHRGGFKLDIFATSSDPFDIWLAVQERELAAYATVHQVDQSLAELQSIAAMMSRDSALSNADIVASIPSNTVYAQVTYPISQAGPRVKAWDKLPGVAVKKVKALARPSVYAGNF
jgi:hypothetical protein